MGKPASSGAMWRYRAEYFVFRTITCLLQSLSVRQGVAVAEALAFFVWRVLPRRFNRYEVAKKNLRMAFGNQYSDQQLDRIIYGMWKHLFRMIIEIVQLPRKMRVTNFYDVMEFRNREDVVRALCSDRPVILLSGHFGNWEFSLTVFGLFGFSMSAVARPLDNPYLDRWFERFRRHTGHRMIAKKGAFTRMAAVLEQGGCLALLSDQDAGPRGTFVDFFGHPASTFPTIARLAVEYDAFICVGYSRRLKDDFRHQRWVRYELGCEEMIDPLELTGPNRVDEITQRFTHALERLVRRNPEQYFWVHRRWKTRPEQAVVARPVPRKAG